MQEYIYELQRKKINFCEYYGDLPTQWGWTLADGVTWCSECTDTLEPKVYLP